MKSAGTTAQLCCERLFNYFTVLLTGCSSKQIISDYESGSGRFSGMGKPTFPSTNKPTYPATYPGTYGSTYGSNKVKDKPTGAETARSKMLKKQQDPERDLQNMNRYQAGLVRKRRAGEVPD